MGTKVHANRCINIAIEGSQHSEAMNIDWAEFETLTQAQCAMALSLKYTLNLGPNSCLQTLSKNINQIVS